MELSKRIDTILGPWPTPDRVREGMLLLARQLQRHDELVALQRDIDAYAADRRMPDDALDSFEAQRDALRREIWEEIVGRLAEGGAGQCEAAADNAAESLDLEAIESKAHRLMVATWECDKLSYTDQWQLTSRDVPALVAEVRRLHAERDADSEVGKAIRELRPKRGESGVDLYVMVVRDKYETRIYWADPSRAERSVARGWMRLTVDDVRRFNERED